MEMTNNTNPKQGLAKGITSLVLAAGSLVLVVLGAIYVLIGVFGVNSDLFTFTPDFEFVARVFAGLGITFTVISAALGVVAMILGKSSTNVCAQKFRGFGKAGFIVGLVCLILCLILAIVMAALFVR